MTKKPKKLTPRKLQDKIWEECKRLIRAKYINPDGSWDCYTCGIRIISKSDAHTAHFIPDSVSGAFLRYDLRNLRVCCMKCNVWLGGNGSAYYRHLLEEEGQEYIDQLFRDKQKIVKAYDHYLELYEKYKQMP